MSPGAPQRPCSVRKQGGISWRVLRGLHWTLIHLKLFQGQEVFGAANAHKGHLAFFNQKERDPGGEEEAEGFAMHQLLARCEFVGRIDGLRWEEGLLVLQGEGGRFFLALLGRSGQGGGEGRL